MVNDLLGSESEITDALESFGFTKLQSKIYLSTCMLGLSSAKEIMNKCEMHKVEVYRVLYELEKIGAIERVLGHPTKFRCNPPNQVINNMIEPKIKQLSDLNSKKEDLIEWLNSLSTKDNEIYSSLQNGFELYRGKFALKKMKEMVENAVIDVKYFADIIAFEEAEDAGLVESFSSIIKRGVKTRGMLNVGISNIDKISQLTNAPNAERRYYDKAYSWMIIIDDKKIIFSSAPKALPDEEFIYTENKQFIHHYIKNYEISWNDSIPMEDRIKELEEHKQAFSKTGLKINNQVKTNNLVSDFEVFQERIAENKMIELADKATSEILYIARLTSNFLKSEMIKTFNKALKRGVLVKGIFELSDSQLSIISKFTPHKQVERRRVKKAYTTMLIFDKKKIIFSSSPEPLPDEDFIYTSNNDFLKHNLNIFQSLWKDAEPFEELIQDI